MKIPTFRVRTLMLAVVVVALLMTRFERTSAQQHGWGIDGFYLKLGWGYNLAFFYTTCRGYTVEFQAYYAHPPVYLYRQRRAWFDL